MYNPPDGPEKLNQWEPTYYSKFRTSNRTLHLHVCPLKFFLFPLYQTRKEMNCLSEKVSYFVPYKKG